MMNKYISPHIALTVVDFEKTKEFYIKLGFSVLVENYSEEKQRRFMLLQGFNLEIEVFHFDTQKVDQIIEEDDLQKVGIKHVALPVGNLEAIKEKIVSQNISLLKDINTSSLGVKNLNVTDPSGLVLEFFELSN